MKLLVHYRIEDIKKFKQKFVHTHDEPTNRGWETRAMIGFLRDMSLKIKTALNQDAPLENIADALLSGRPNAAKSEWIAKRNARRLKGSWRYEMTNASGYAFRVYTEAPQARYLRQGNGDQLLHAKPGKPFFYYDIRHKMWVKRKWVHPIRKSIVDKYNVERELTIRRAVKAAAARQMGSKMYGDSVSVVVD